MIWGGGESVGSPLFKTEEVLTAPAADSAGVAPPNPSWVPQEKGQVADHGPLSPLYAIEIQNPCPQLWQTGTACHRQKHGFCHGKSHSFLFSNLSLMDDSLSTLAVPVWRKRMPEPFLSFFQLPQFICFNFPSPEITDSRGQGGAVWKRLLSGAVLRCLAVSDS